MSIRTIAFLAVVAGLSAGCARRPAVSAEGLQLRRVVVYRNGVGYFERSGHIKSNKVFFKVKGSEVGDFLATLAVIEQGGSSVKSASFPIHVVDKGEALEPPAPVEPGKPAKPKWDPNKLQTVVLELDGKEHDLSVGYIAETPVWRPSYRLVIDKGGSDLQAWGIVQNLSGENWKDVSLSLIAGAPLAFEATLGTPVIPLRPTVTDTGEVIAAVPRSETTLSQEQAALNAPMGLPPPAPPAEAEPEADGYGYELAERAADKAIAPAPASVARRDSKERLKKAEARAPAAAPMPSKVRAAPKPAPMVMQQPMQSPSAPRNLSALAAVAVEGSTTRYDLPTPITVPDKNATMVMLLSKRVPGESIYLFAPDGAVGDSQSHPFRVARFTNKSGGLLERGPIAIFEKGAFLGQGMLDPLPDGATTTVPFALERGLAIDQQRTYTEEGARIAKIESGQLTLERDSVTKTRYRVKNGGDKLAKLLVKHARQPETRLFKPPKDTEDNVGTGTALVPVETAARSTAELTVDERRSFERVVDWMSPQADDAVRLYMADKRADANVVAQLRTAWDVRIALKQTLDDTKKLTDEQSELQRSTDETRRNLRALEKNKAAGDLRQKLTARLAKDSLRLDEVIKRLIEVRMKENEQRVRLTETLRSIKLTNTIKPE